MNRTSRFYAICDKLSLAAISLFALECVLGSSGHWLSFGSISIRMLLFGVCFLVTLPNVLRQVRTLARTPSVIFTILLGAYLVIAAFIGWRGGNNRQFIVSDITSYMTLALLPGFLATIRTHNRVCHLVNVIFYGSLALGIVTTVLHFFLAFAADWQINALNGWLNNHHMGGLANLGTGVQRVYMRSQMFLQVGLLFGLQKIWSQGGWKRWLLFAAEGILAYACLMTFTRGFWLGFALSALFILLLEPSQWKRYLTTAGVTALMLVVLFLLSWSAYGKPLAAQEFIGRFNPDLISGAVVPPGPPDPSTDTSDPDPSEPDANEAAVLLRRESLQMLGEKIKENPILGNGLGANLDGLRDDGKVEYMYYDILMKTGAVGLLFFCLVFFLPAVQLLSHRIRRLRIEKDAAWTSPDMDSSLLLAAYLGIAITSYVNPFLLNPMGILLTLLITSAAACPQNEIV